MRKAVAGIALALWAAQGAAAPITPAFDTFGTLAAATFGGSGIPNDSVAISTSAGVTLGLSAASRFGFPPNPTVTDDNAGRFFAARGVDTLPPSPANPLARWNFNFYLADGSASLGRYNYTLFYDFDPGADTEQSAHGRIDFATFGQAVGSPIEASENLGFDFLETNNSPIPGVSVTAPAVAFNPNAAGEYSFALVAFNGDGSEAARAAIVVTVVPEPGVLALLGIAFVGLAAIRRRK